MFKKRILLLVVLVGLAPLAFAQKYPSNKTSPQVHLRSISNPLQELQKNLTNHYIYSNPTSLVRNSVMQSFDIDSKGDIYYDQLGGQLAHVLFVIRSKPNQSVLDYMQLKYFGHGTNIAIEEEGTKRYLWINSVGTKKSDGAYGRNQTFSRVLYQAGSVLEHYGGETYYLPGHRNIHPAIDKANNILALTSSGSGDGLRHFIIFKLNDVRNLVPENITLSSITYGGGTSGVPETSIAHTLPVKNLNKLVPIASFSLPINNNKEIINSYAFQGFDVDNGNIYFFEGEGNGNSIQNGVSNAYVSILNFKGQIVGPRTRVQALDSFQNLQQFGFTDTGYMEAEGIKVRYNTLFLGFAAKGSDEKRKASLLQYSLGQIPTSLSDIDLNESKLASTCFHLNRSASVISLHTTEHLEKVSVYNSLGEIVHVERQLVPGTHILSIQHLTKGLYYFVANNHQIVKWVKL